MLCFSWLHPTPPHPLPKPTFGDRLSTVAEADLELMILLAPCLGDQGHTFPHLDRLFAIEEKEASNREPLLSYVGLRLPQPSEPLRTRGPDRDPGNPDWP